MNELDLEELEERLYSQIYHSEDAEHQNSDALVTKTANSEEGILRKDRYFSSNPVFSRFQKQEDNSGQDFMQPSFNKPQADNSIVDPPQGNIVYLTGNRNKSKKRQMYWERQMYWTRGMYWKRRMHWQRHGKRILINCSHPKPEHIRFQGKDGDGSKKSMETIALSDSDENNDSVILIPPNWPLVSVADSDDDENNTNINNKSGDIVFMKSVAVPVETLSASDESDDSVILIPPNWPLVSVADSDDDENNTNINNKSDDVFMKSVAVPVETITLEDEKLNSPSTKKTILSTQPCSNASKERNDLLSTPDSTSNDFINHINVRPNDSTFNVSLHGSGFNNSEPLHPEPCETESTSTTTDSHVIKTSVVSEVEFPNKDLFSDANLESFGDSITPRGMYSEKPVVHCSTRKVAVSDSDSFRNEQNSSDSSYEIDFEESQADYANTIKLSNLSQITINSDTSRNKKRGSLSKFDLLNVAKKSQAKKRSTENLKKKKKKSSTRSDASSGEPSETDLLKVREEEQYFGESQIAKKRKSKKHNCSETEDDQTEESKRSLKKKKSRILREV